MNNYILCRWRDAITDPPPNGWKGHVSREERNGTVHQYCTEYMTNPHSFEFQGESRVFFAVRPGDQWLDITDEPGVPREAVQAAVDEMTVRYWEGAECILHEVGERDHCEGCALDKYPHPLCKSLACIMHETGVTPTEVL